MLLLLATFALLPPAVTNEERHVKLFSSELEIGDLANRAGLHLIHPRNNLTLENLSLCVRFEAQLFTSVATPLSAVVIVKEFDWTGGIGVFHLAAEFPKSLVGFGGERDKHGSNFA